MIPPGYYRFRKEDIHKQGCPFFYSDKGVTFVFINLDDRINIKYEKGLNFINPFYTGNSLI